MTTKLLVFAALLAVPARASDNAKAVERLKAIEQQIRSQAAAADEEIRRARDEAGRITKEAEEESARIRAEAEAYTRQIQREIEAIRKRDLAREGGQSAPTGAPRREAVSDALASLVDPILNCWEPPAPPARRRSPTQIETCVMDQVRQRLKPFFR